MISGGQSSNLGPNAQAAAALSLFLQFMRVPEFSYIHLEAPDFQDFNLVFDDGKKIICESRERERKFSYPDLRKILKTISRANELGDQDEILIISKSINEQLTYDVNATAYFEEAKRKFSDKGYSSDALDLLPKVRFWKVPASNNKQVVYSLFSELIGFWMPQEEIERIVNTVLLKEMKYGAETSNKYSREDILNLINQLVLEYKGNTVYYHYTKELEEQFSNLEDALANPEHLLWTVKKECSGLSISRDLMSFALHKLSDRKNLILEQWKPMWKMNNIPYYAFNILYILKTI